MFFCFLTDSGSIFENNIANLKIDYLLIDHCEQLYLNLLISNCREVYFKSYFRIIAKIK